MRKEAPKSTSRGAAKGFRLNLGYDDFLEVERHSDAEVLSGERS